MGLVLTLRRATTSASNIHRRALCPGSANLEEGAQDQESDDARLGTLLHGYYSNPKLDPSPLKPGQRDLLRIARDTENFVFTRAIEQFVISADEPFIEGYEEELFALTGSESETPGHCDRWRFYHGRKLLIVIDQKFGFIEVTPAEANYQLRVYAIGGATKWSAERVIVAISQPRLRFEERCTMAEYATEDISASEGQLIAIRAASRDPNAPLIAGESQCRYCKAKLICSAFREAVGEGVALVPMDAISGTVAKRQENAEKIVASLPDEKLDKLLCAIQLANFVKTAAKDEGRARVAAGRLNNYKLGKESEIRDVVDVRRAVSLLVLRGKLTREDVMECASLRLGDDRGLEGKIRDKTGCTWKQAREMIDDALASVIERSTKKARLIRTG